MAKCAQCGYLAVRHFRGRYLAEVEKGMREGQNDAWPVEQGTNKVLYIRRPLCFLVEHEIGTKEGDYASYEFKAAIEVERDCQNFTKWQQGFTPKEHREMLDREWRLKFQVEREEADRKWRDRQSQKDRKWRTEQDRQLATMAGLFTVLGAVIGGVIVALTK